MDAANVCTASMGWQDAGDWDTLAPHLEAAAYLMVLVERFPSLYNTLELGIPGESGNDVPDLLEQALWLVRFFFSGNLHSRLPLVPTPARLMRHVTNGIPLGCPLFLPVHIVTSVQTLMVDSYRLLGQRPDGGVSGVRCAFSVRHLHSRMPLDPMHVRLNRTCV